MDELRSLLFGVGGGVIGAFLKFWIEDLRNWEKGRLSKSEKRLLRLMNSEDGKAIFKIREGRPPCFKNRIEDLDHLETNFIFEDHGELARLESIGYIETNSEVDPSLARGYRLTGIAYKWLRKT